MGLLNSYGYGIGLQAGGIKDYSDVYKFKLADAAAGKQQKERDARWKSIYNQVKLNPDAVLPAQSEEYRKKVADLYHGLEQSRLYDPNGQSGDQDRMLHEFNTNDIALKNGKAFTEKNFLSVPDKNLAAPTKAFKAELLNPSSSTNKLSQFPSDELGSYVKDVNPSTGQVGAAVQWTVPETTLAHIADAVFRPQKTSLTQLISQTAGANSDYINRIASTIPQTDVQARQIEQQNKLPSGSVTSFDTYANLMWQQPDVQHLTAETHRGDLVKGNEGKSLYDGQSWKDPQVAQKAFDLFKDDLRKSIPVDIKIQDRQNPVITSQAKEKAIVGEVVSIDRVVSAPATDENGAAYIPLKYGGKDTYFDQYVPLTFKDEQKLKNFAGSINEVYKVTKTNQGNYKTQVASAEEKSNFHPAGTMANSRTGDAALFMTAKSAQAVEPTDSQIKAQMTDEQFKEYKNADTKEGRADEIYADARKKALEKSTKGTEEVQYIAPIDASLESKYNTLVVQPLDQTFPERKNWTNKKPASGKSETKSSGKKDPLGIL